MAPIRASNDGLMPRPPNRARCLQQHRRLLPKLMRLGHLINADKVIGTHRPCHIKRRTPESAAPEDGKAEIGRGRAPFGCACRNSNRNILVMQPTQNPLQSMCPARAMLRGAGESFSRDKRMRAGLTNFPSEQRGFSVWRERASDELRNIPHANYSPPGALSPANCIAALGKSTKDLGATMRRFDKEACAMAPYAVSA